MPKLIVYQPCLADLASDNEGMTITWGDQSPALDAVVSLGEEARWQVVQVISYSSVDAPGDAVYLTYVHPVAEPLPPQVEWDCYAYQESHPNRMLHLHFYEPGQPHIYCEFNYLGQLPPIAQPFEQFYVGEDMRPKVRIAPWVVDQVTVFLPIGKSPYPAIHLAWCKPRELAVV